MEIVSLAQENSLNCNFQDETFSNACDKAVNVSKAVNFTNIYNTAFCIHVLLATFLCLYFELIIFVSQKIGK